jgi:hypothetical protein
MCVEKWQYNDKNLIVHLVYLIMVIQFKILLDFNISVSIYRN